MTRKLLDDCFLHDRDRLKHAEAIAILQSRVATVVGTERVSLVEAAGRILATPAIATNPVPAHTNSAVDGFAFAAADYDRTNGTRFPVEVRVAAGDTRSHAIPAGSAARIFTGAIMPDHTDTVAMQEDCVASDDGHVTIPGGLKPGANVRRAGEDVERGSTLMTARQVIRPQDIAALASIGMADIPVFARLRVGLLSSGNEVIRAGAPLQTGQVYDANMPMLSALIGNAGATVVDLGIAPDDGDTLARCLQDAATRCDVIIASGGASRGEEDHLVTTLDRIGKRHLWQLAIKPGRPMMFGQIGDTVVLGMPGNPVAVFVCFLLYGWPMLRALGGATWPEPRRFTLPATFAFPDRKVGRREYWRGMLVERAGALAVDKFRRDGSGLISGLRAADGLIEVPEDVPAIAPGDPVTFIPFSEFGIVA